MFAAQLESNIQLDWKVVLTLEKNLQYLELVIDIAPTNLGSFWCSATNAVRSLCEKQLNPRGERPIYASPPPLQQY